MKIVLLESLGIAEKELDQFAQKLKAEGHEFCAYEKNTDEDVQIERAKDADVIMIANMPLSGKVIRSCPSLKYIDVAFTGVDHVDLEAAKERKVAVSNASGYSNESVAELSLCMMLSLLRNVKQVEDRCRNEGTKDGLVGRELKGKTVGIVGLGAIGKRVAQLVKAFGCEVLAYSRHPKEENKDLASYVSLDELLQKSDIVTLHCPLTDETRHIIDKEKIGMMKQGAILINAARGPVVDYEALAAALEEGKVGGAGIDVFEGEPPIKKDHPMLKTPNTIATPHIAFASAESMTLRAGIVFDNLEKWVAGKQQNVIL